MDTHLDSHTAAVCDARGRVVSKLQVPATAEGYAELLAWARSAARDSRAVWAVAGTRHYGLGLARYLTSAGEQVSEIGNSRHVGKRRAGKSDAIDAGRAARELLTRPHPAQMRADGDREALRLLMIDRDNAVQSCNGTALGAILFHHIWGMPRRAAEDIVRTSTATGPRSSGSGGGEPRMASAAAESARGAHRHRERVTLTDECGKAQLVDLEDDLDLATADGLTERGYAAIGRGARVLLIDLARVPFCDPRGLSALVQIANHADRADCRCALLAAQPQVVRLLQLTSLDQRLPVFATAGDALAQLMPIRSECPR